MLSKHCKKQKLTTSPPALLPKAPLNRRLNQPRQKSQGNRLTALALFVRSCASCLMGLSFPCKKSMFSAACGLPCRVEHGMCIPSLLHTKKRPFSVVLHSAADHSVHWYPSFWKFPMLGLLSMPTTQISAYHKWNLRELFLGSAIASGLMERFPVN